MGTTHKNREKAAPFYEPGRRIHVRFLLKIFFYGQAFQKLAKASRSAWYHPPPENGRERVYLDAHWHLKASSWNSAAKIPFLAVYQLLSLLAEEEALHGFPLLSRGNEGVLCVCVRWEVVTFARDCELHIDTAVGSPSDSNEKWADEVFSALNPFCFLSGHQRYYQSCICICFF